MLRAGGFLYCPPGHTHRLRAASTARAGVIEKQHQPLAGFAAATYFRGHESEIEPQPLLGDPALEVRALVPANAAFDFAVNTMTYQLFSRGPHASLEHVQYVVLGAALHRQQERKSKLVAIGLVQGPKTLELGFRELIGSRAGLFRARRFAPV